MRFNSWSEEGRRGQLSTDAVQSSGQWVHGGRDQGGTGRWQKTGGGGACSASVLKEEEKAGRAKWAKRPIRPMGRLGQVGLVRPVGPKGQTVWWDCWADWAKIQREKLLRIKIGFFEFSKALEICTRRFWRNFDTRTFLNYSRIPKDF
jgi:hypothetical protein